MGEHAVTHCAPRLKKVVEGDQSGVSQSVEWSGGGGFTYYRLGSLVFDSDGSIRRDIQFQTLAAHIWFSETNSPLSPVPFSTLLGINEGRAIVLLYNGVLGDKRPKGGNVLTREILKLIRSEIRKADPSFSGSITIYGELSRLSASTLDREGIEFRQTPYDVNARA